MISPVNEKQNCEEEEEEEVEDGTVSGLRAPLSSPPTDVPPPPPPMPTSGQRKRRVRSFYWKPIPEERVHQRGEPNLWTLGRATGRHTFHIDATTIEELFGQREDTRPLTTTSRKKSQSDSSEQEPRKEVTILDTKRGMNVAIFLKRFKKSNQSIIQNILDGNSAAFGPESLRELTKLLPESEEVEKLQQFRGEPSQLSTADNFIYKLTALPRFNLRIEAMLLKEEFHPLCSSLKEEIDTVHCAIRELLSCAELHSILHLVLEAGNIMNAGGYGGNAVGFKLSSLLSLADTKANKPGMNLLHFVALEAQKKDQQLLLFPEKLLHMKNAARVSVESLDDELESLQSRISHVQEKIQADGHTDLVQQHQAFLQTAVVMLAEVSARRLEALKDGEEMIDFFCEDKETFKLDECFHIFQNFCSKFKKAVQENVEREMRAESRLKRLKEVEVKPRLWTGMDKVGRVFGSRCSSETDVQAALKREGLFELLKSRPHSPHSPQSPLGQFGSLRRSRQHLSDGNTNCTNSHTDTHSPSEKHTPTHTDTGSHSAAMSVRIDTYTLIPALQAFSFEPHSDHHHENKPPEIHHPDGPVQADLCTTEDNTKSSTERRGCGEETDPVQKNTEVDSGPKHSEKLNEEENISAVNPVHKPDSISSPASSTASPTDLSAEAKPTNQKSGLQSPLESSADASANTTKQDREHKTRQSFSSEHKRLKTSATSKPKSATRPSSHALSPAKPRPLHPVRTLTPSESQSMRKVISLGRNLHASGTPTVSSPSKPSPPQRLSVQKVSNQGAPVPRPSIHKSPVQRSSEQRSSIQRSSEQRSSIHKSSEQRSSIHKSSELRSSIHKSPEQRTSIHKSPVQRSSEQRSSIQRSPEQRSSIQRSSELRSSIHKSPVQKSSTKKVAVQHKSPPEEKMCRSTLRALAQAGGSRAPNTHQTPKQSNAPHFAQGTVASTTRRAVLTPGILPVSRSITTSTSKVTSHTLNRATSLRLAQSKVTPQSAPIRAKSVRQMPSAGKKNLDSFSEKATFSRDTPEKPLKPVWR